MEIRSAKLLDAAAIAEVHVASWRAAYRGLMPESVLAQLDPRARQRMWEGALASPQSDLWVAASPVAGFCHLIASPGDAQGESPREGEVTAMYLRRELWQQGIGRRLMQAVLHRARERGYETLHLWVLRDNARARGFYEAMGFRPDGREQIDTSLIGSPLSELCYERVVPARGGSEPGAEPRWAAG